MGINMTKAPPSKSGAATAGNKTSGTATKAGAKSPGTAIQPGCKDSK